MPDTAAPRLVWQGEDCLCLRWPPAIDTALNTQVHLWNEAIRGLSLPGMVDAVPCYSSLALHFDPQAQLDRPAIEAHVTALAAGISNDLRPSGSATPVELPVCYHATQAPDLDAAAERLGLTVEALIERHTDPVYQVALLGFAPGFPYLLGMDPGLALPRHSQPRPRVAAGSVGIAGGQTGIYPQPSPGGWQLVGRTPWRLFDPQRAPPAPPARLAPGARVRFVPISPGRFAELSEHPT
ncbi:5-oxoprolinase subunit PxpB [Pseudomarimonas salicorniae]|uniref:5-oxoprolinase subunit PxpB n=1 Tax=Pseudomarimonas salicorniae TaxID=2933270 RepID=A0ABT0GHX4_9GAMM|nr:5-oxoprolinase subunit PxpB [Lysobacter sp. CAU 1642]MCK7594143.1 5-oxoprolinase subunit PxpB [Lysobacter sp. CAU 1642]